MTKTTTTMVALSEKVTLITKLTQLPQITRILLSTPLQGHDVWAPLGHLPRGPHRRPDHQDRRRDHGVGRDHARRAEGHPRGQLLREARQGPIV